jgi:MarR family transcriptional regulator, lower aerobic nicotinate degradation pathway regulator
MNYKLLMQLIEKLADYEQKTENLQESKIEDFAGWLLAEVNAKNKFATTKPILNAIEEVNLEINKNIPIESEISRLVAMMYRYAKIYIKKAIENSGLQTIDEFGYLAGTDMTGSTGISKTDLIAINIHEKTTGTEILKRLLKEGLLRQEDSQEDKRSKLLFITDKGRETFFGVLGNMHKAGLLINGNLTSNEKETLLALLVKLRDFHHPIFLEERENSLETLFAKFIKG